MTNKIALKRTQRPFFTGSRMFFLLGAFCSIVGIFIYVTNEKDGDSYYGTFSDYSSSLAALSESSSNQNKDLSHLHIDGWWYQKSHNGIDFTVKKNKNNKKNDKKSPNNNQNKKSTPKIENEDDESTTLPQNIPGWPDPVIIMGLPRNGENSIEEYFKCGGVRKISTRNCIPKINGKKINCATLMEHNVKDGRDPFYRTGDHDVYTRLDVVEHPSKGGTCYLAQVNALEEIHKHHPSSTFILNVRDVSTWIKGMKKNWPERLKFMGRCQIKGLGKRLGKLGDGDLKKFYEGHLERVRKFVKDHPTHKLLEVRVDDEDAGKVLGKFFDGVSGKCWVRGEDVEPVDVEI